MYNELKKIQEKFKPIIKPGHYMFIAPSDKNELLKFIEIANKYAPRVSISRTVHQVLSSEIAIDKAVSNYPSSTPFEIFVVTDATQRQLLPNTSLKDYCETIGIDYNSIVNSN